MRLGQILFGKMGRLTASSVVNIKNKSHAVTAELDVPEGGANGVILAQGGAYGGWAVYAKDGRPSYCYNLLGRRRFKVYGDTEIPAGEHQVRVEFAYDGGGLGKGGTVTLYLDGKQVGEGRVDGTQPMIFSATRPPTSGQTPLLRSATTATRGTAPSPGRSAGSRSTWARTPRTPIT